MICVMMHTRDDAFLWLTAYPDSQTIYAEEDLGKAIEKQSKELFKCLADKL